MQYIYDAGLVFLLVLLLNLYMYQSLIYAHFVACSSFRIVSRRWQLLFFKLLSFLILTTSSFCLLSSIILKVHPDSSLLKMPTNQKWDSDEVADGLPFIDSKKTNIFDDQMFPKANS